MKIKEKIYLCSKCGKESIFIESFKKPQCSHCNEKLNQKHVRGWRLSL